MAGIGFVLRKLARQDNLSGLAQAYAHSALAATGPWLFTVVALGSITLFGAYVLDLDMLFNFKVAVIYNFCFSLVFSAPVFMVATRYLADSIYAKDVSSAPGMLFGCLMLIYGTQIPVVVPFYLFVAELSPLMTLLAIMSYMLITGIWLISVFMTALKDYNSVTRAFGIGMVIAIGASFSLAMPLKDAGLLIGFTLGLIYIFGALSARIFIEYPYVLRNPFAILPYFKKYWEIALSGLLYNMAVWVDKWVMWVAPQAEKLPGGLVMYPNYDGAMFLAYLSIVPAMAVFIFSVETNFFEHYIRFYRDIQNKATFKKIQRNHRAITASIFGSARNFVVLQGTICTMAILMAPQLFELLGLNFLQIGIFRYGVLGALFHVLTMFLLILLSYFDNRKAGLIISLLFLVLNAISTWISMRAGFEYYGYGYFISSTIVFVIAAVTIAHYVRNLPYHAFITTNSSIR